MFRIDYNRASLVKEARMPSNAALLDEFTIASALTGAAVAADPQAYAASAKPSEHVALRRMVESRMMPGFRSMHTCPEGGWVWVRGGSFNEPKLRTARGEQWRREKLEGKPAPTYWAPAVPPTWDEEG